MCGKSAYDWKTMPIPRLCTGVEVTSLPFTRMLPAEGSRSPAIMRSVVVLPQPEGPSRATRSPC